MSYDDGSGSSATPGGIASGGGGSGAASTIGAAGRKVASALQPMQRAAATNVQARSGSSGGGSQPGASAQDSVNRLKILGSMRKGGRVKKTGAYILHKNEHVKPARKKAKREKKRARGR